MKTPKKNQKKKTTLFCISVVMLRTSYKERPGDSNGSAEHMLNGVDVWPIVECSFHTYCNTLPKND